MAYSSHSNQNKPFKTLSQKMSLLYSKSSKDFPSHTVKSKVFTRSAKPYLPLWCSSRLSPLNKVRIFIDESKFPSGSKCLLDEPANPLHRWPCNNAQARRVLTQDREDLSVSMRRNSWIWMSWTPSVWYTNPTSVGNLGSSVTTGEEMRERKGSY